MAYLAAARGFVQQQQLCQRCGSCDCGLPDVQRRMTASAIYCSVQCIPWSDGHFGIWLLSKLVLMFGGFRRAGNRTGTQSFVSCFSFHEKLFIVVKKGSAFFTFWLNLVQYTKTALCIWKLKGIFHFFSYFHKCISI